MDGQSQARQVHFTWGGVLRGAAAARAMGASVLVYGLAFGLMSREAGLGALQATLMSIFVNSGSAQLAATSAMNAGSVTAATLAATILVINARYLLFGASLRPWLGQTGPLQAYGSLFVLGDGNWMLSMRAHAAGENDAGFILGSGLPMFGSWILGTLIGSLTGAVLPDPRSLGFDFMLAAFAAAMMTGMVESRRSLVPLAAGAAAALLVQAVAPAGWAIIAAGLAGAATVWLRPSGAEPA